MKRASAMVSSSKASDSSSIRAKRLEGEQGKEGIINLPWKLNQLKKQIQASRLVSIREKLEKNKKSLSTHTCQIFDVAAAAEVASRRNPAAGSDGGNMLSIRLGSPLCNLGGLESMAVGWGEKEIANSQEEIPASGAVVFGSNGGGKSTVRMVKLPFVEKIPPYTTWIFLDKNQRMAEDQSVVGRRRIYYDPHGNETLICSDSDEEIAEPEEEKHEFSEGEDQILRKALEEHGISQEVLDILCQFIDATPAEMEERYEKLLEKNQENYAKNSEASAESEGGLFLNKTLNAALDSFDNLFCRRCLIFDCRLHGCSQSLIIPSEKLSNGFELEENQIPCGDQCYLRRIWVLNYPFDSDDSNADGDSTYLTASVDMLTDVNRLVDFSSGTAETSRMDMDIAIPEVSSKIMGKRKVAEQEIIPSGNTKLEAERSPGSSDRKQNLSGLAWSPVSKDLTTGAGCPGPGTPSSGQLQKEPMDESSEYTSRRDVLHQNNINTTDKAETRGIKVCGVEKSSSSKKGRTCHEWTVIEKDLYLKGIEIFGKNSCLIARNLLSGLKTCMEVSNYMRNGGALLSSGHVSTNSCLGDGGKVDHEYLEQEMPPRTRIWRRRGRARKLKYTWKSAGHPAIRKRIADGKQQSCRQYIPCGCQPVCGKQCPCQHNGTCCEKYCGCSKSCKNRFRGCHCAKSQCRSRQCPCFAAGRECDPDVCRNCWVSCGDGSLGEPPERGDGYQCGNMKLLLKQQQRILLARSDVAGWGAFIKNPVNKNDYLGEYTGELISHKEADKRGKIYDRANSSFLFDLNDQYVLDAYRKGDKLKFANHSSNPNCYAKVMLVAGDHRVGIFAKEHIEASEELFYDYRYGPDQAPAWARKPEGSKRDDSSVSHGRAQKIA